MKGSKEIFAVYFPSWHVDRHYEKWYGKGFSEWKLMKTTKPLFPGHLQPKEPLWGYFDEADPEWMARQIDLAADHGITGFMFDWYWYGGEQFLERPLDEAFLNAPNRNRLKFFLMWANHNWSVWPALLDDAACGMQGNENQSSRLLLKMTHSEDDLRNVMDFCCEKYFCCENYWKIDGKPVYSFYNCNLLFDFIPPNRVLEILDETAKKHGFPGIYTLMNIGCCNDNEYFCGWGRIPRMKQAGFDAVFAYNSGLRSDYQQSVAKDKPVNDYSFFMSNQKYCWERIAEQGLPFVPSITLGLDVSPRWSRKVTYPWDFEKLSYYPICINNTPERVGELLEQAMSMDTQAVIINAWNEWSEGMFLLPEKHCGTAYLDMIGRISRKQEI
ncbi:MAG: glycoside hydrolase family 99-like domain-containing protein [Victivallales bacterium]|nr:glycoside hydrolase family 99-like domain-containing protein [Victivallales bacterium]